MSFDKNIAISLSKISKRYRIGYEEKMDKDSFDWSYFVYVKSSNL